MTDTTVSRKPWARSLAGEWDVWLGPASRALDGQPADRTMAIPANWWLRDLDHAGLVTFARDLDIELGLAERHLHLRFDGVDYRARVFLDGVLLGSHEGYFEPFGFDLPDLRPGRHRLVVEVDSPDEPWGTVWHMNKTLIKGVLAHHDARPGNGWSRSGQAYNSGGIWGPVTLTAWISDQRITDLGVRLTPSGADEADLHVDLRVSAIADDRVPEVVDIVVRIEGPGESAMATFGGLAVETTGVISCRARLPLSGRWTTWDRGTPALHEVTVSVHPAGDRDVVLDERRVRTGIRSVRVDDEFRWHLNEEEVFIRGTNYIGTFWPSAYTEELVRQDLLLLQQAGINQVRVHAHVAGPAFYDVADELGLMVWQDFPLQWGYADTPAFHAEAMRQFEAMVGLLGHHPSVVAWCCHNESPWDAPWMAEETGGTHDPAHNRQLDADLEALGRRLDPTRYVHRNSGTRDAHHYAGWYFGRWEDFAKRPGSPFVTEYGSQAPPGVETLRRTIPSEALAYDSARARAVWSFHDFQHRETKRYVGVLPSDGLERYVDAAQAYQARLLQVATEAYRRGKAQRPGGAPADGGPLITGIQQFMAVEGWASVTWAVLDHERQPKPGYHALARSMAPLLVMVEPLDRKGQPAPRPRADRPLRLRIWVVNDAPVHYSAGSVKWRIRRAEAADGEPWLAGIVPTAVIEPDSAAVVGSVPDFAPAAGWYRIDLRLCDEDGVERAANHLDIEVRR